MARKPSGIDERPEQLRPSIVKGKGSTNSEINLARIAERSFLNLWSYPCPYRDQKLKGKGSGKELCDLLVVCGNHIIIFSEKTIAWPGGDLEIAWSRWTKRALRDSAKQAAGAERWITRFESKIFLDPECNEPFPIDFPPANDRIFHRVVVAQGASEACKKHFGEGSGSLVVTPSVKGSDTWTIGANLTPFAIGDLDPSGSFVHVIDNIALKILLKELDTIRDFTDYLVKRSEFIRSGNLVEAHGEENLFAYYAIRTNDEGDHDFVIDDIDSPISIDRSKYSLLVSNSQYIAKREADKVSYFWDMLIEQFTTHMLDGTSISLLGHDFDLRRNEIAVRYMALQRRFVRRNLGSAVAGALEKGKKTDRFFRLMISPPDAKECETGFFILTFKYTDNMDKERGYEEYRRIRAENAEVYAKGVLERYPHLDRIIGIAREPPDQGAGISEDLIYAEQHNWSTEDREVIYENCRRFEVLQSEMIETRLRDSEYPEIEEIHFQSPVDGNANPQMNRKQRRAKEAKSRKKKRR